MNDDIIQIGSALPRITDAAALDGRKVRVTWKSGETVVLDLGPTLHSRRLYRPLREDDQLFKSLTVSEYGNALEWPGDIEVSALTLSRLLSVEFDNEDFRQAMDHLGYSLEGMAQALEVSRRLVADYRKDKRIPRHIGLATRYLVEHDLRG
jgi:hypothetical protein